jgi:uncharacterized protein
MSPEITTRLAETLTKRNNPAVPIQILWHCGEPLAVGYDYFCKLIAPFAELEKKGQIVHAIQTNATLIDRRWCEFFKEHNFQVCLSLDGPVWANHNRVDWSGKASYSRIIRGINHLKEAGIPFSAIAVVNHTSLDRAAEIYNFFVELGCRNLCINIEEQVGVNLNPEIGNGAAVRQFWRDLFKCWREEQQISIREFTVFYEWWNTFGANELATLSEQSAIYLYPTVGWQGDVVLLSPEFLGMESERYHNFVVGNLYQETLPQILHRAKTTEYVQDFIRGKQECRTTCPYYTICRGGYASNKYFELGTTAGTETEACRNSRKYLQEAVLSVM